MPGNRSKPQCSWRGSLIHEDQRIRNSGCHLPGNVTRKGGGLTSFAKRILLEKGKKSKKPTDSKTSMGGIGETDGGKETREGEDERLNVRVKGERNK